MKPCPNCRVIYPDDYNGQCSECGGPMGGTQANGNSNLAFAFAQQVQRGQRENSAARAMARGNYDGVKVETGLLDVARSFVIVDEAKLREAENAA